MKVRPQSTQFMVEKVNQQLVKNGILDALVTDVETRTMNPLTGGTPDVSCPYLTQLSTATSVSCRVLVDLAVSDALTNAGPLQADVEQQVEQEHGTTLTGDEVLYVKGWGHEAMLSGIDVGGVHAAHILRAQGVCDQAPTPPESAFNLGEQQGNALLESTSDEVLPGIPRTICNTDTVAAMVLTQAQGRVDGFVTANPLCAGYSPSQLAQTVDLSQAEGNRRDGIDEGLRTGYEALRVRLVGTWVCQAPPTGDPLVVDLAGQGVRLARQRAAFDLAATGERVLMPALGAGNALLVLDRNGNGRIDSGAELFSNAAACGRARCIDGIEALRALDDNRDGVIDRQDPVFAELQLWRDLDGDGQSSADELMALAAAGLRSISLDARLDRAFGDQAGNHSLRSLSFARADGQSGTVYDVWFSLAFNQMPRDPRTTGIVSTLGQRYR
jgi:hypothetical protein